MSHEYKYEFTISPCNSEDEYDKIIDVIHEYYHIDDENWDGDESEVTIWGEATLYGGRSVRDRHNSIKELFPGKMVGTRWKSLEGWDAEF